MFRASRSASSPVVRLTCLALCFALVFSSVSFAVSGKGKKKPGANSVPGSAAQRTQGPPSPNLPNLNEARRIKPGRPKAPNPVPATKCRRRDKACKKAKGEVSENRLRIGEDKSLLAYVGERSSMDSPFARSTYAGTSPLGSAMWAESDLAAAQLDPNNRKGTPGEDLLSRNFNWSLPLLSLPERAGLDLGLGISYNSLVWTKVGSVMEFDLDWGAPTPGFRLGFPTIQRYYFNPQASAYSYLLILPSGRRVELRQIGTNLYEAVDSSYLHLTYNPGDYSLTLRTTDGTQLKFEYWGDEWKCTQIKDRNGNFITITYTNYSEINNITDTLGRVITFNYDSYNTLNSITQTWSGQTHTWATFAYGTQTIQTNFPGLTLSGAMNGNVMSVLTRVGLDDGSTYSFEYNTYCQVKTIRRYAPNISNPVNFPNDYFQRAYTTYNLPADASAAQTDCPRFTTRTDWAYEWNSGVTNTYAVDANWAWGQVTLPDNTIYKEFFATSGWQRGLTTQTETWSGGVKKKWTTLQWTQDNTGISYLLNPRVTETNVYDDAGNRRRTTISYTSYGASYGLPRDIYLPTDVYEYDADATTVLRRTHTDYNLNSAYASRRIIGLPSARMLYDGGNNLASKVWYFYDESGFVGPDRLLQTPPIQPPATSVVQHDGTNYGNWQDGACPTCIHERGNLTTVRRYNVTDSTYVETRTGYHTTGSPIFVSDPLDHKTRIGYQDSFSDGMNHNTFAYPTTTTVSDPTDISSFVQYNYDHGSVTRTQDPKGAVFERIYDTAGRLTKITNKTPGHPAYDAHTEYVYAPNQYYVQSFTTINDLNLNNRFYSITVFDGHDRVRATASDHPTSAGQNKAQYNVYDVMGRLTQQSNPTEINAYWAPYGDDAAGWVWSNQAYDWQGRPTVSTDQEGKTKEVLYGGCGCAGGQVVVTRDEVGRRQKMTYDILGRLKTAQTLFIQPKEQPLDGNGTVYSTTTNTYNVRDQITNIEVKDEATSVSQNTQMFYDGHGRLKQRWAPIYLGDPQSATPYDKYEYNADDTLWRVTDPRGVKATYSYNNRHMVVGVDYDEVSSPNVVSSDITFGYDAAGNRTLMDDAAGRIDYVYDTLSRLQTETRQFDEIVGQTFQLAYGYNLAGQLNSLTTKKNGVTDSVVTYAYNKAGQPLNVDGPTGFGSGSVQFISPAVKYRAWGSLKEATFGDSYTETYDYDVRLQLKQFKVEKPQMTLRNMEYQYYNDGRASYIKHNTGPVFNRLYTYDHVGRLETAKSGAEADGEGPTNNRPFRQTYQYDVWNNLTGREHKFWSRDLSPAAVTYTNDRGSNWGYDVAGNVSIDEAGLHTFDSAGRQAYFAGAAIYSSITQAYDGDNLSAKRIESRPSNTYPPVAIISKVFYLRSSVLGGLPVAKFDEYGNKSLGRVYAFGEPIAEQFVAGAGVGLWRHRDPITGGWDTVNSAGSLTGDRGELDPLGSELGQSDPYLSNPDPTYTGLIGDRPQFLFEGDPFNAASGCTINDENGLPIQCSLAASAVNAGAAVLVQGPTRRVNNGRLETIQVDTQGNIGWSGSGVRIYAGVGKNKFLLDEFTDTVYEPFIVGQQGGRTFPPKPQPAPTPMQKPVCYVTLVARKIAQLNTTGSIKGVGVNAYHLYVLTRQSGEDAVQIHNGRPYSDGQLVADTDNFATNWDNSDTQSVGYLGSVEAVSDVEGGCGPIRQNFLATQEAINTADIPYTWQKDNSNAVAYTFLARLDNKLLTRLERKLFSKLLVHAALAPNNIPRTPPIIPGWGNNLLSR